MSDGTCVSPPNVSPLRLWSVAPPLYVERDFPKLGKSIAILRSAHRKIVPHPAVRTTHVSARDDMLVFTRLSGPYFQTAVGADVTLDTNNFVAGPMAWVVALKLTWESNSTAEWLNC